MPLAAALSLVVLACWGVLLVTRGRVRRVVAVLGLLAALGLVVAVVVGLRHACPTRSPDAARERGRRRDLGDLSWTAWFWAAAVAAVALGRGDGARGPLGAGTGPRWAAATTPRRRGGARRDAPPEDAVEPRPVEGDWTRVATRPQ